MTTTSPPTAPQGTELPDVPSPGSIVQVRGREWVTLPQSRAEKQDQVLRLRPLGGGDQTIATLFWPLEGEQVRPASFALPDPALSGSQSSALLLRDALLLKLRAGAGPFRCLGNVALEPRPYQLVPLLMALKQEVSRVLIADEVGLGKTVEALLIARELLDRGEIRKVTVICSAAVAGEVEERHDPPVQPGGRGGATRHRPEVGAGAAGGQVDLRCGAVHCGEPRLDQERPESRGLPAQLR
jgi:hypothetical protein